MSPKKIAKKKVVKKVTRSPKKISQTVAPAPVAKKWYLGNWGIAVALFLLLVTVVAGFSGSGPLASLFATPSVNKVVETDGATIKVQESKQAQNAYNADKVAAKKAEAKKTKGKVVAKPPRSAVPGQVACNRDYPSYANKMIAINYRDKCGENYIEVGTSYSDDGDKKENYVKLPILGIPLYRNQVRCCAALDLTQPTPTPGPWNDTIDSVH